MELGRRIRSLRQEKGLSQEALAEKLEVSRQAVAKWEHGSANPSTANLIVLGQIFEVPVEELVRAEEAETQKDRPRLPMALLITTLVLALLTLLAVLYEWAHSAPTEAIGYADGPTAIFVTGVPLHPYILGGLTAAAAFATLVVFLVRRSRMR